MTRDRAIEILRDNASGASLFEIAEAVDMAIEALKERTHGEWTEERAIDFLHDTGWMQRHDEEMTRPHGEWIYKGGKYWCSSCGEKAIYHHHIQTPLPHLTNFCPNCGSDNRKMGEAE